MAPTVVAAAPTVTSDLLALATQVDVTGINEGKIPKIPLMTNKKFQGQEVVVGSLAGPPISSPFQKFGPQWEEATGAKIKLVTFPFAQVFEKLRAGIITGSAAYDLITISPAWAGDFMGGGYLDETPADVKTAYRGDDIYPTFTKLQSWAGKQYALQYDGDCHQFYYRRDLFDNVDFQNKYKAEYGTDLKPPETWGEYLQTATFFNSFDWSGTGRVGYGMVEPMARGGTLNYFLLDRGLSYSKVAGDDAVFFDPDTMKPRLDEPGFIKGMEDMVKQIDTGPPGVVGFGFPETRPVFISGQAAMDRDWGDIGTLVFDKKLSQISGKLGSTPTPGVDGQVYDRKAQAWKDVPKGTRAPYLAFGGWMVAVPKAAKSKEAAWDLAAFMTNPITHSVLCVMPDSGIQPARKSTLQGMGERYLVQAGSDPGDAKAWLNALKQTLEDKNAVPELRIPGTADYYNALDVEGARAMAKELTPEEAMKSAAKSWEEITDRLGRDKQKAAYAASLAGTD